MKNIYIITNQIINFKLVKLTPIVIIFVYFLFNWTSYLKKTVTKIIYKQFLQYYERHKNY